ncbi:MAG: glycosyltransferase family A protein [Phycisphaeraceae bacterium]
MSGRPDHLRDARACRIHGQWVEARAVGSEAWQADVVVGVSLHNQAATLPDCLASIWAQELQGQRVGILLLDDASTDPWMETAGDLLSHPGLVLLKMRCGSAAASRNAVLDFVDAVWPCARWVARLDADDRLASSRALSAACSLGDAAGAKFVLGGNGLRQGGRILARDNAASEELLRPEFVLARLKAMAKGTAENEIPSCNLLLARRAGYRYPLCTSAEDHWLVVDLLLNHPQQGVILTEPMFAEYDLGGDLTRLNRRSDTYLASRRQLLAAAEEWADRWRATA